MVMEVSDYYREKGIKSAYLGINGEQRKIVTMVRVDGSKTSMAYAKYLYTSHYRVDIPAGDEIDHINNDKTDDRIENLQVLSKEENRKKSAKKARTSVVTCPICGKQFEFRERNRKFRNNPCCSRSCGSKMGAITAKERHNRMR